MQTHTEERERGSLAASRMTLSTISLSLSQSGSTLQPLSVTMAIISCQWRKRRREEGCFLKSIRQTSYVVRYRHTNRWYCTGMRGVVNEVWKVLSERRDLLCTTYIHSYRHKNIMLLILKFYFINFPLAFACTRYPMAKAASFGPPQPLSLPSFSLLQFRTCCAGGGREKGEASDAEGRK